MAKASYFTPGFFQSLVQSCYSTEFYHRIKSIRMRRAVGFLFLFSALLAALLLIFLWVFSDRIDVKTETVLEYYDEFVPDFDAQFENNSLQTIPPRMDLFLGYTTDRGIIVEKKESSSTSFIIRIDTDRTLSDAKNIDPGFYAFRDGIFATNGYQSRTLSYNDFEFDEDISFSKQSLRPMLKLLIPRAIEWTKEALIRVGPVLVLLYVFIGGWIKAVIFSLLGMILLLITNKSINYPFLLRLSFYASVPGVLVFLITALLGIAVPYLPLIVYLLYYYYGLRAYQA